MRLWEECECLKTMAYHGIENASKKSTQPQNSIPSVIIFVDKHYTIAGQHFPGTPPATSQGHDFTIFPGWNWDGSKKFPTYPWNIPQASPGSPKWKEFLHKLFVPGVCWGSLRMVWNHDVSGGWVHPNHFIQVLSGKGRHFLRLLNYELRKASNDQWASKSHQSKCTIIYADVWEKNNTLTSQLAIESTFTVNIHFLTYKRFLGKKLQEIFGGSCRAKAATKG